ncbi:MAG: hypothetical protein RLN79_03385 [Cytophagales bacterium]
MPKSIVNDIDQAQLQKIDSLFISIQKQYGRPPNWQRTAGFKTLCQIILEQQVSLESARAHFKKLDSIVSEFSPEHIVALSDKEMRNAPISRQKASYLKNLSNAILEKTLGLGELKFKSEKEIREKLTAIKGIGNWTTEVYLMFCLQFKDIMPIGDVAIVNTIKELKGLESQEEILEYAEKWKPYRSLASFYLWHYYLCKRNRNADSFI